MKNKSLLEENKNLKADNKRLAEESEKESGFYIGFGFGLWLGMVFVIALSKVPIFDFIK